MQYYPIKKERLGSLDTIFADIRRLWTLKGGNADALIQSWISEISTGEIQGIFAAPDEDSSATTLMWMKKSGRHYANILIHQVPDSVSDPGALVQRFLTQCSVADSVLELITYIDASPFEHALLAIGYTRRERQKMYMQIPDKVEGAPARPGLSFCNIGEIPETRIAKISCRAHAKQINRDAYIEFANIENRSQLSKDFQSNDSHPYLSTASRAAILNETVVAVIEVLRFPGPNNQGLAWIADISVDPDYQGQGLGRHLLLDSLSQIKQIERIDSVGLCVTCTNTLAIKLYDTLGFSPAQKVLEYISPEYRRLCQSLANNNTPPELPHDPDLKLEKSE